MHGGGIRSSVLVGTWQRSRSTAAAAAAAAVYSGLFAELTSNELKRESIP